MLESIPYCPLLHTRQAEMKALAQLPAASKDRLLPIIVGRPWPNANQLSRTWDKIGEAFGGRRFGLDLDETKLRSGSSKPASGQYDLLFDPSDGFKNYYELIESIPSAIPVLRLRGGRAVALDFQLGHVERLQRGLILRVLYGSAAEPFELVRSVVQGANDVVLVLDAGWSSDLLGRELWTSQLIELVVGISSEAEIVVCSSSFPESFANVGSRGTAPIVERVLYANLSRRHNSASLTYGDWGSTRPPREPAPMRNVPRIDLPVPRDWVSFRQVGEEDYADIATRLLTDPSWNETPEVWGKYAMYCTASDLPGAIKSPAAAASARINIHLHLQASNGDRDLTGDTDEPYSDD